jgi:4'-phosphopantetheinyl transferase
VTAASGPWRRPSRLPALSPGAAQVWSVALDLFHTDAKRLEAVLCAEERRRAARYRRDQDRIRFIAARATLRCLLAAHLGAEPRALAFAYGANGKPALIPTLLDIGPGGRLAFNLSHSGDLAVIALAHDREVGVDVERLRPLSSAQRIAERLWSSGEAAALGTLDEDERLTAFFATWTRKEAVVKALGEGITDRLDGFQVPTGPAPGGAALHIPGHEGRADAWWLTDLRPAPGYLGALVLSGSEVPVSCWRWPPQWGLDALGSARRYRSALGIDAVARSASA